MVPLFPTVFLFDEGQSLQLEVGSVNSESVFPAMRHEGGDRTQERFAGKKVTFFSWQAGASEGVSFEGSLSLDLGRVTWVFASR